MPDDKTKKRPQDASRINLSQSYEVEHWCNHFDCNKDELRKAVDKVGTSKEDVADYLKKIIRL